MPTYVYLAVDPKTGCKKCKKVFEEIQSIMADALTACPQCGKPIERQPTLPAGFITLHKQPNQYNDCIGARTWRDSNGNLHKVTSGDGHSKAGTTPYRKNRSDEQIAAIKKRDEAIRKKRREADSYRRFVQNVKKK